MEMENGNIPGGDERQVRENGPPNAGSASAWVRPRLADSIYLWACGEKAGDEEDDPKISDRLIGWLILWVQGFAYAMLFFLSGLSLRSDTDSSSYYTGFSTSTGGSLSDGSSYRFQYESAPNAPYLFPAVTGAVYLLITSTTHDLRAGYSLLVDGECVGHRAFGIGLLSVYGIMVSAAMEVLMSTSEDSASVVLNAVTVIFIADLDEKALKFLSTVPQKWRLFWAIYSIGISFILAMVAFVWVGEVALEFSDIDYTIETVPSWILWVLNPLAVTIVCYRLSVCLQQFSESYGEAFENVDQLTIGYIVTTAVLGFLAAVKHAKQCVRDEPCFYAAVGSWVVQGLASWRLSPFCGLPLAINEIVYVGSWGRYASVVFESKIAFMLTSTVLVFGLGMKAFGGLLRRHGRIVALPDPVHSSDRNPPRKTCCSWTNSRVPALLIGWGIGYWINSLLFVLGMAWHVFGRSGTPTAVQIITYTFLPCLAITSISMAAGANFLGAKIGAFVKPAVDILHNRRSVVYWTVATVFRDVIISWVLAWALIIFLYYYL